MADTSDSSKKASDKSAKAESDKKKDTGSKDTAATKSAASGPASESKPASTDTKSSAAAKPNNNKADDKKPTADAAKDTATGAKSATGKTSSVPPTKPAAGDTKAAGAASSGGRSVVVLIIVIALIAGGGFVTRDVWLPMAKPYLANLTGGTGEPGIEARVADLEKKLDGIDDAKMAQLQNEGQKMQAELSAALSRIDDLERRLAEVRELASSMTAGSGTEVDLSGVMSRIDDLETSRARRADEFAKLSERLANVADGSKAGTGQGLLLAVAQLRDGALSGKPYAAQLDVLKRVAGDSTDVIAAASALSARADKGLPTPASLEDRFGDIAGDIVIKTHAASTDWIEQTTAKLASLVELRRTDGKSGDPVEDAVAVIEKQLADADLGGAAATATALSDILPDGAKAVLEPWLLDLKARVSAERALDAMRASALAGLDGK